jgi:hypothetical protein
LQKFINLQYQLFKLLIMKKNALILSLALTLGMLMASCGEKKACYQLTGTILDGAITVIDEYYWGTAEEADVRLAELKEANSDIEGLETMVTVADKAEADCTGIVE